MKFERWRISRETFAATESALRSGEHEVFALWTGPLHAVPSECQIGRLIVPAQRAGFAFGAFVHIDGSELARIQFANFENGERSYVQLHTHPSDDVRMSDLDREWEVVRHVGALSIIVPRYCRYGLRGFHGVNVYEREPEDWRLWGADEVSARVVVTD